MKLKSTLLALGFVAALGTVASAAGFLTGTLPLAGGTQYPATAPLTGNELIPADTQLTQGQNPASEAISVNQLGASLSQWRVNYLIGGNADTNLWQRATTGASETTTFAYGGPDRWAYWSGTSTAVTLSKVTTAAALPAGNANAFRFQRTAAQTGVVQACMAQEIESVHATSLQGQTVELDFNAFTGANYSAAGVNMTAYIIYGTGTDEGMQKLAFGLNAGGGGSSGWTGQANATAAVINLGAVSTAGRYAAVATIPATATEAGVALCFTPTGTAGTTDALYFDNIQLVKNPSLAKFVSATAGYTCANASTSASLPMCSPTLIRDVAIENALQYRYYYQLNESAVIFVAGACKAESTTVATCFVQFPVVMRVAPTMTYANGFATETTVAGGTLGACTTLATASTVASTAPGSNGILVGCTAATVPAAGSAGMLYSNSGTGAIKASAEL